MIAAEIYRGSSYGALHPLRIPRVPVTVDLCRAMGWLPPARYLTSPRAKPAALTAFHTPDYIAALQAAEAQGQVSDAVRARHGLGTLSNPVFPEMFRRPATGAGGVMLAAQMLADAPGRLHVPGGGTHHGLPDRANGFCYLNDPVLAILTLRRAGLRRVAYVDIDAHHPDGVEPVFAGARDILMLSVHEAGRWPGTGLLTDDAGGRAFNLPVPAGMNDSEMAAIVAELIVPRVADFAPDAIVLQAGADALDEDPLSRLSLSNAAYVAALQALLPLSPRFLLLGGGGYNPWSVGRCWAVLWATLSGQPIPAHLPQAARDVLAAQSWGKSARPPPAPAMLTTLLDKPRPGPVRDAVRLALAALARRR